jgi:hypothetical protein
LQNSRTDGVTEARSLFLFKPQAVSDDIGTVSDTLLPISVRKATKEKFGIQGRHARHAENRIVCVLMSEASYCCVGFTLCMKSNSGLLFKEIPHPMPTIEVLRSSFVFALRAQLCACV